MKRTITILFLSACSFLMCSQPNEPDKARETELDGWRLVWNDEFDGSGINPLKWTFEVNGWGGGNNELQYYTDRPENAFLEDGKLVILAREETYTGPDGTRNYTSARMITKNKGDWLYGRFDIRARLPRGQGLWPAIWMMPTDNAYGNWPRSGEIDIMEYLGHDVNRVYGTLHYTDANGNHLHTGDNITLPGDNFTDEFHLFTIEWDTTEFRWYVDGNLYQTQSQWSTIGAAYPAPFNRRFFMILNVAVGGNWPGNPDNTTVFPQRMEVEYVRVYEKE